LGAARHYYSVDAVLSATDPAQAFDEGYPVLFAELSRLCRALGAGAAAEDAAQEALVYGRTHLGDLRDPTRLRPWLRTIAVRHVSRSRIVRDSIDVADALFLPVDSDLGLDASRAVARLPLRERQAVALVYGLGYRQEDAAEILGLTRGGLAASLWKARRRLARDLADYREASR